MKKKVIGILFIIIALAKPSFAQLEQLQNICSLYFSPEFVSDGQEYFSPLKPDQKVEFRTTFFSENTYRLVVCTNLRRGDLVFSVYDTEKNLLFTNASHNYTPYWNFRFTSTVTCIIQIEVLSQKFTPGYAMLLIGYKP